MRRISRLRNVYGGTAVPLTDVSIRNAKPRAVRYEISDGAGLRLAVQPSGHKSFVVRFRIHGRQRKLTYPLGIGLKAVRVLAAGALLRAEQGIDPALEKRAAKARAAIAKADTVRAICEEYLKREGPKLRSIASRTRSLEQLVYPRIGALPIASVTRNQITRLIDEIEDTNGLRRSDLVLCYLRRIFGWHALRSDTFLSPICRGMARWHPRQHARSRVLDHDEIRLLWAATELTLPFHRYIRFLLLTACRPGEAAGLPWTEIKGGTWHLPASRHKRKVDFARPLSGVASAVIAAQPRINGGALVFSNNGHQQIELERAEACFR